jgi:hypothetical protein
MKARRLRLPPTPSPAVEKLRDYLREIYSTPMPWHSEQKSKSRLLPSTADTQAEAATEVGVSQPAVSKALNITKKEVTKKRLYRTAAGRQALTIGGGGVLSDSANVSESLSLTLARAGRPFI